MTNKVFMFAANKIYKKLFMMIIMQKVMTIIFKYNKNINNIFLSLITLENSIK